MYSVQKHEFNQILLGMTERITTGFSLPATNPNPRNKERERKGTFTKKQNQIKSPSTFTNSLMIFGVFWGTVCIDEEGLKLPIVEDFSHCNNKSNLKLLISN